MNARRDSSDEPEAGSSGGRVLLVGAVLFAAAATGLLVLTDEQRWLRLGIVAALWAALVGAFLAAKYRRQVTDQRQAAADRQELYELELEREIAARREYELELASEVKRQAEEESRDDIAALRGELSSLRQTLEGLLGGEFLVERYALRAESTRMRSLPEDRSLARNDVKHLPPAKSVPGEVVPPVVREAETELIERIREVHQKPRREPNRAEPRVAESRPPSLPRRAERPARTDWPTPEPVKQAKQPAAAARFAEHPAELSDRWFMTDGSGDAALPPPPPSRRMETPVPQNRRTETPLPQNRQAETPLPQNRVETPKRPAQQRRAEPALTPPPQNRPAEPAAKPVPPRRAEAPPRRPVDAPPNRPTEPPRRTAAAGWDEGASEWQPTWEGAARAAHDQGVPFGTKAEQTSWLAQYNQPQAQQAEPSYASRAYVQPPPRKEQPSQQEPALTDRPSRRVAEYRDPKSGYQDPPSGYRDPASGYRDPASGYRDPKSGYQDPPSGYRDPSSGYHDPTPSGRRHRAGPAPEAQDAGTGGRRRRAEGAPSWQETVGHTRPEEPTGSHANGRSVSELLASHGGETSPRRRRRREE